MERTNQSIVVLIMLTLNVVNLLAAEQGGSVPSVGGSDENAEDKQQRATDSDFHSIASSSSYDDDLYTAEYHSLTETETESETETETESRPETETRPESRRINIASFHSIPGSSQLSPTRHDQGDAKSCWMYSGATFIRGALNKYYPDQIVPEHDELMSEFQYIAPFITDEWMTSHGIVDEDCDEMRKLATLVGICNRYKLEGYDFNEGIDRMRERKGDDDWAWTRSQLLLTLDAMGPMEVVIHMQYWRPMKLWMLARASNFVHASAFDGIDENVRLPGGHSLVLDQNHTGDCIQTKKKWSLWAFKNSHGDGIIYVDDSALRRMIENKGLFLRGACLVTDYKLSAVTSALFKLVQEKFLEKK